MPALLSDRELLDRLVAEPSVSTSSNERIAAMICDYLDRPGIVIERHAGPERGKVNLVVRAGPDLDDQRQGLAWSGHLDVVPAEEPQWESDPFRLAERDGKLFGRGTCDMKGSMALAINILARASAGPLPAPLVLVLSCDEELGSLGIQHLASSRSDADPPLPRRCIVGEPTSLRAVRMHKGHLKMRLAFRGRSAHSGSPHLGVNAIEPAASAVAALARLRQELEQLRAPTSTSFPEVPHAVLCVARIEGGEALNVVPERCTVELGVRLLPGMESAPMIERVRAIAKQAADRAECEVTVINDNPPMLLDDDAPIHRDLCRMLDQQETHGVSFASDAGVLQRDFAMECVLFGPGSIEVAHRPNEYVPVDEMKRAREVLERLAGAGG